MRRLLLWGLILVSGIGMAQKSVDVSNPQATIDAHINLILKRKFDSAVVTLNAPEFSKEEKIRIAKDIKSVLDSRGRKINIESIPSSPNYVHSESGNAIYYPDTNFTGVFLEKVDGKWLYSAKTCRTIPEIVKEAYPFGTWRMLRMFEHKKTYAIFDIDLWQIIGILVLGVLSAFIYAVTVVFSQWWLTRIINKAFKRDIEKAYVKPILKPVGLVLVFGFLTLFVPILQLPIGFAQFLILGSKAGVPIFLMVFAYRMVDVLSIYFERLADKTESKLDDQLVPLIRKALKTFVIIIGTLFTLQNLDFNVTALLAGVSIGGLAIAFAAQDTLKNLFGSLTIFLDKPFQIGDWIVGPSIDGSVEEVGFRSTRIRTFGNSVVSVPNGNLADSTIDNMGKRRIRRFKTSIALTYDTPTHQIQAFVEGLRKVVEEHPDTTKDNYHVYLNNMGASSLDILFYIFFDVPDWGAELKARHEIILSIIKLAEEMKVRFAFNTQTIHIEDFPEKTSLTPSSYPNEAELQTQAQAATILYDGKKD